jgi:protein TonB
VVPILKPAARPQISTGVSQGLLLQRIEPRYPYAAILARIEGNVVLTAVINSEGRVEQLQAQSGHPLLIAAALDAVRQWRYRPYLLNGKPTEVEAQLTVAFHLQR